MARLPDDEIERLKAEVSLVRLVEVHGVALKRQGKDYLGRCPFHDDKTPSLVVSPASNLWHCLGACQAGGSVIDWVMKTRGVSFRHAVELLRSDHLALAATPAVAESSAVSRREPVKRSTVRQLEAPVTPDIDDVAALQRVVAFYHTTLQQSVEAQEYLARRGLRHPELINHFQLGYANRTLAYRLPEKNRQAGAVLREQLQRLGILRESGHEHFNGSLVVPVLDGQGRVVELYGRKLNDNLRVGTPKHLYLPGPHAGVWNEAALQASTEVILCESLIDAMTFWCAGYRHVTTSYGVSGFTAAHRAAFRQYGTRRVLIAYDRDAAGDQAALALAEQLMGLGIECFRVLFPKGMDANEYALRVTPATQSLGLALRRAEWMGQGPAPVVDTKPMLAEMAFIPLAAETPDPDVVPEPVTADRMAESDPEPMPSASPVPEPAHDPSYVVSGEELRLTVGERFYRVRGLPTKAANEHLKVNLYVRRAGPADERPAPGHGGYHVDTVDLYSARQRQVFARQAAVELGASEETLKRDLGQVILSLEDWQEQQRVQAQAAQQPASLSETEKAQALALLRDPDLLGRILSDFDQAGVVGEENNKLVGYLACVSRKLSRPLAIIIQSSSAAGKSSLQDAVLAFMPSEDSVRYSAMTGQSVYYLGQTSLKHKILALAEEEGAARASYALKLLQSDGELTIASTGKDASSGQLVTQEYRVEGPVMLFLTTTAIDIDEELLNRCLVLTVNESRAQTQAIHVAQRARRTLTGLLARVEREAVLTVHRHAQRLLRPLAVVNPYADQLTFLDHKTRTRRDHEKYLTLIDSIALLHQYQRELKRVSTAGAVVEYIEVTRSDIVAANRLAHAVLGHCLDELPPQTRQLLRTIAGWVRAQCQAQGIERSACRFTRKAIREACGWGGTQLGVHLERLVALEYVLVHRGGRGQSFVYELLHDAPEAETAYLPGLLTVDEATDTATTRSSRGETGELTASSRPESGPVPVALRAVASRASTDVQADMPQPAPESAYRAQAPIPTVTLPYPSPLTATALRIEA